MKTVQTWTPLQRVQGHGERQTLDYCTRPKQLSLLLSLCWCCAFSSDWWAKGEVWKWRIRAEHRITDCHVRDRHIWREAMDRYYWGTQKEPQAHYFGSTIHKVVLQQELDQQQLQLLLKPWFYAIFRYGIYQELPRYSCMDLISFISSIYRNIWSSYEKCYPSFWTTSHQILWKHRSWYYDYGHSCTFNLTVLMNTLRSSFHVYFSSDQKKWWCPSGWVVYLVHTFDQFDSFMLICGPVSNMTSRHYPTHRVIRQS